MSREFNLFLSFCLGPGSISSGKGALVPVSSRRVASLPTDLSFRRADSRVPSLPSCPSFQELNTTGSKPLERRSSSCSSCRRRGRSESSGSSFTSTSFASTVSQRHRDSRIDPLFFSRLFRLVQDPTWYASQRGEEDADVAGRDSTCSFFLLLSLRFPSSTTLPLTDNLSPLSLFLLRSSLPTATRPARRSHLPSTPHLQTSSSCASGNRPSRRMGRCRSQVEEEGRRCWSFSGGGETEGEGEGEGDGVRRRRSRVEVAFVCFFFLVSRPVRFLLVLFLLHLQLSYLPYPVILTIPILSSFSTTRLTLRFFGHRRLRFLILY